MKKTIITLACATALLLSSCAKKGEVGPSGAPGTNGTNGTPGANGTNGTNGTNGNANVSNITFNTTNTSWVSGTNGSYYAVFSIPAITQNVVDRGNISVYYKSGTQWLALPLILGKNVTEFSFENGYLHISNFNSDFSANSNPGVNTFRVVIIPASN